MKFCTKCGAQLFDDAMICVKCGCMVEGMKAPAKKSPPKNEEGLLCTGERRPSTLLLVFNFLFTTLAILSVFWLAIAFAENSLVAEISVSKYYNYSIDGYTVFNEDLAISAVLASLLAMGCALVSFIMTLIEKHRGERLFSAITKLVGGFFLTVASVWLIA